MTTNFGVSFTDSLHGFIAGSLGTLLRTTNGGTTWTSQEDTLEDDLNAVAAFSSTRGWAVGASGRIMTSTNSGTSWQLQSTGMKVTVNASYFATATDGWEVGENGTIIRTTDGGLSWTNYATGIDYSFDGVFFLNDTLGWAVGDSGYVFKTTNRGATWAFKPTPTDNSLYSVYFVSSSVGWAVGDAGTILKTVNGGSTWAFQHDSSLATLMAVRFLTPTLGLVTADDGTVLRTTNGGTAWSIIQTGSTQTLYSITGTGDSATVYIAGDVGTILKTVNAGQTWIDQSLNLSNTLYGVSFISPQTGWIAGDGGTILVTTDGGNDWFQEVSGTQNTLFMSQVVKSGSGALVFITGQSGVLMCAVYNAFAVRTWTGAVDTNWTNPSNWSPNGVPQKLDSIVIGTSSRMPAINSVAQQITLGSLVIPVGSTLTIRPSVAGILVKGNLDIAGSLVIDPSAVTQIEIGGGIQVESGGNFSPGRSEVTANGNGAIRGNFYTLVVTQFGSLTTSGNVSIGNELRALGNIAMRRQDTLTMRNSSALAFSGIGVVSPGTIKRIISKTSSDIYRFESSATTVQFDGAGIYPDSVAITTYPDSLPAYVPDSVYARRTYTIKTWGGNNPKVGLYLRFDTSETAYDVSYMGLFRDSSGIVFNMNVDNFNYDTYPSVGLDSTYLFSTWYIGKYDYTPYYPLVFSNFLIVGDNGHHADTLAWGAQPGASSGLDVTYGETALGAKPPTGTFDARWRLTPSVTSYTDIMNMLHDTLITNTYRCEFQPGSGGYPFTFRWDSTQLPLGNVMLEDAGTGGTKLSLNMKLKGSCTIADTSITAILLVHKSPVFYSFQKGWNLMSYPLAPLTSASVNYNFPQRLSSAYGYNSGYAAVDTFKAGVGYWLKFNSATQVGIEGSAITGATAQVANGWNMVGSLTKTIPLTGIQGVPSSILQGNPKMYAYSRGYAPTDSIRPAQGYWVKTSGSGFLQFSSASSSPKSTGIETITEYLKQFNSITVSDRAQG
ncbi:MAG TPA: YCF48-related protein, partial [Bacteroidota bacterium]|nr:YCF48-related protein [Bacteroidota bacterium]